MNVNLSKTKSYYRSIDPDALCGCSYCKNYYLQIKAAYPKAAAYLASLGIDMEKPFETSPLEPDADGVLEYCACQYIVFGSCQTYDEQTINDMKIRVATSYPNTGIQDEHFVLELYPIRLKWKIF